MKGFIRILGIVAATGLLVLLIATGLLLWVRSGEPKYAGALQVPGLEGPVEIRHDSLGVPHIRAASLHDLFFAQGYVHARDRLWQMEMFRRVAAGRLSEVFGEKTVEADRFLRTLGLGAAAAGAEAALDAEARELLDAYVAGVNAGIRSMGSPPPPEFLLLGLRPEPWTVVHTLAIEKIMAWDLTDYSLGLELAVARSQLGDSAFTSLLPEYPSWGPTIVGEGAESGVAGAVGVSAPASDVSGGGVYGGRFVGRRGPGQGSGAEGCGVCFGGTLSSRGWRSGVVPPSLGELARAALPPPEAARLLAAASVVRASNAWVIGPERSASGKPILANDMHLGLRAPTLWYLVGLHAPGFDVVGVSIPGAPTVVAGHNRAVAWGYTNGYVDDGDFFIERVDPADSTRYLTPWGSEPFRVTREEIRVRGRAESVVLTVRWTRHGPVMTPVEPRAGGELLAFRWVGHDPSPTFSALLALNRAASVDDVVRALRRFRNPHQNVVFADSAGRFGYWLAGRVPLRRGGGPPLIPVPGWTGAHDWTGELPFEAHPHALDPPEGFIVTANNRQSRDSISALITGRWAEPYRAIRIRELILAAPVHDAGSVQRMQLDVRSAFAARYRDRAVAAFRAAGLHTAADTLAAWKLDAAVESRAAALFYTWVAALRQLARRELYGADRGYYPYYALVNLLERGGARLDLLARAAAARAAELTGGRRWGELHQLVLEHGLGQVPVLGRLLGFSLGPFPREGSLYTVNVAEYDDWEPPFRVSWGPSQRHVVDFGDVDGAGGFILPGGQSGFPYSRHYRDQLERWRAGALWRLPVSWAATEAAAVATLRLEPVP